jgi:PAS domain S-box-containing protein
MATNDATILIVDSDTASARAAAAALAGLGLRIATAQSASQALVTLAADAVQAVLIDLAFPALDRQAIAQAAIKAGAVLVARTARADPAALRTALELGCRGLSTTDALESLPAEVRAALDKRQIISQRREDYQRLKFQHEELRRQCAQQAERFQDSQETYFLDLSRMMTIISNIMDGIVFTDRDGNVTLMNPVAENLLGVKSFQALGKHLPSLQGCEELLHTLAADHARMQEHKEVAHTVEVHHSLQDLLYIKVLTRRVLDYRGQTAGVLTVLKDVTAEYKSDQLKNQYLSIVAHELRTPLTGIKTFSTMMCKGAIGALTPRQQRVIESIREQSLRLEHQIDKLINLGHLESDEYGQDREVFALSEFTNGLIAPFEQPARDRFIELAFHCDVEDTPLYADRADLRRACQAIIENAVKFTPDRGKVDVSIARQADGGLRFSVKDTGIGVDPRYHRRIFEKFFQVEDPLTRHHGGAGLGLFVAKGIVESHGSRIEVSSKLGQGADFSLVLPLYVRRANSETTAEPVHSA